MCKWISVEEKPIPDEGRFLVGLDVYNRISKNTNFEYYDLVFDLSDIRYPEYNVILDAWKREDFTHWRCINTPQEPKENKQDG